VAGTILTFYSYKGGTGRSLALANVAWILASRGQRVLCIDWDLEAPGLHRYFAPFLSDAQLAETTGLIDWLYAYLQAATSSPLAGETAASQSATGPAADRRTWSAGYADISRYAQPLQWSFGEGGEIDFVGAGQQNPSYALRVGGFDWDRFYSEFGGSAFLEHCAGALRAEYDFVLIDSRTGISDTAGICTVQMPDAVALFFTLNNQSIEGVAAISREMLKARAAAAASPLRIYPCATRIELAEKHKLERRRRLVEERFGPLIAHSGTSLPPSYLGEMEVLYDPFYAYDEMLATVADQPGRTNSVLAAMERLTGHLTQGRITRLGAVSESLRIEALRRYELSEANAGRDASSPAAPSTHRAAALPGGHAESEHDVFIAATHADDKRARLLHRSLQTFCKPFYVGSDIAAGEPFEQREQDALAHAKLVVVLLSKDSLGSGWFASEAREALARSARIVPVYLDGLDGHALAGSALAELAKLRGVAASSDDELREVVGRIQTLLGVHNDAVRDADAGVQAWRERAAFASAQQQRMRLQLWIATGLGAAVSLSFGLAYYGVAKQVAGALADAKRFEAELGQARTAQHEAEATVAQRDQAVASGLRERITSLAAASEQWLASSTALARRVDAFNPKENQTRDGGTRIDAANDDLEVSSSVAQDLAGKLADLKTQVDGAPLSDAPKAELQRQLETLTRALQQQQPLLAHVSTRLDDLAKSSAPSKREQARTQWRLGYAAYNRGEFAIAQRYYEAARKLDPSYAPALNSLGRIALDNNRMDEAAELFTEAIKRDPNYAPAAGNMAVLRVQQGELREAKDWAHKALKANPDYAPARVSLERIERAQSGAKY
jgi:tetratricopeptide (TPR) repeat protein